MMKGSWFSRYEFLPLLATFYSMVILLLTLRLQLRYVFTFQV